MGIEYVDIFYHHRPDPETPLEETMAALDLIVKQGKALYVGISNYPPEETQRAIDLLKEMGTSLLIHQPKYSMLVRQVEKGLLETLKNKGVGCIPFSPLAQGLLTDKYINGIPEGSRVTRSVFLQKSAITPDLIKKIAALNKIAADRSQSLAQMALAWVLRNKIVTSVLIGASKPRQISENVKILDNLHFQRRITTH